MPEFEELTEKVTRMKYEIQKRVEGYHREIDLTLVAIAASGHILFTGVPGLAKTLLALTIAEVSGCTFKRIQMTPSVMPLDITGSDIWRPDIQKFEVRPGPIFANVVLADELNRTSPKTQSALIEAMQENTVSIGNETIHLPRPFTVMATRNPIDHEGTFSLTEANLDRFMFEIEMDYPSEEDEIEIAKQITEDRVPVEQIWGQEGWISLSNFVTKNILVSEEIYRWTVALIRSTREFNRDRIELGASPRASKMCIRAAQAHAMLVGKRQYVVPEDVNAVAEPLLRHRLIERPSLSNERIDWKEFTGELIDYAQRKHIKSRI